MAGNEFTVKVAAVEVTDPAEFVTVTAKVLPLSVRPTAGVV
jgi:hypothetical protein